MESLTRQDLIDAAKALRESAHRSAEKALEPGFASMRRVYERSAQTLGALAAKIDRVANKIPAGS